MMPAGRSGAAGLGIRLLPALLAVTGLLVLTSCSQDAAREEDPLYHEVKGDQLYERGDYETALKEYSKALEMGDRKLKVFNNLGNVHFRRGQTELAEKYYRQALEVDPSYLFSLNNLALAMYRQQNFEAAKKLLLGALDQSPSIALLHNSLAQILIREGDLEGGVDLLKRAVEINPDYAIALNNLGDVFLKQPQLGEDPMPFIMRAIEKDPDNNLFYDTLGWYYCQMGVFDEALIALGKAFVQEPENVEIRVHYATALEWIGKEKEAMEQWQAIMEMPGDKELINLARRHYWEIQGR